MTESSNSWASLPRGVEQLEHDNWIPWKMKMEAVMQTRGLIGHMNGSKPKQAVPITGATEEWQEANTKWETDDCNARALIKVAVHQNQAVYLFGAETARQLWEQLRAAKEPRGQAGILAWRKKLYGNKAKKDTDIPTHLATMRQTLEMLHLMGDEISDREYWMALMQSLPRSWEQFLTIYSQPGTTASDITSHKLHAIL